MANPNAIVARVERIQPPVERPVTAEALRAHPEGFSIDLEGERTARLPPGDRAAGTLEMLEELRRAKAPVYIETDPESRAITRLLIPILVQVEAISEHGAEDVAVELRISQARHVLKRATPDFGELLETLRAAQAKQTQLAVTETDAHEIIDARPYPGVPPAEEPFPPQPLRKTGLFGWIEWLRHLFCCLFRCLRCVPERRAAQMFALVSARTCDPLAVPPPCIPFLYPDDGCWGRAHEMRRLMVDAGVTPRKVWIYGNLRAATRNNPNCEVHWGWHVAPTLCVRRSLFRLEDVVIDPSLFDTPVSKARWKGVQGDPGAQLVGSDGSVFYRSSSGYTQTDPGYTQTATVLATYRLQLKNRSLGPSGPPPYAYCP